MIKEGFEGHIGQYNIKHESAGLGSEEVYSVRIGNREDSIVVTGAGKVGIQRDPRLLEMAFVNKPGREYLIWDNWTKQWMRPGLRSAIYKNRISRWALVLGGKEIAIKQVLPDFGVGEFDSTAFEQFKALEALRSGGFLVVPVLLATEKTNRLILEWYHGEHPMADNLRPLFAQYIDFLDYSVKELTEQGKWDSKWGSVDRQPRNYFIGELVSSDIKQHFVILDPISRRSMFIF